MSNDLNDQEKFYLDLFKFGRSLLAYVDIEQLVPVILQWVIEETKAARCRIILYNQDGEILFNKGSDSDTQVSRKIVAFVKAANEVFVSANAMEDARLYDPNQMEQTVFRQRLLSVACAPIRDQNGTFGVVYIDNRDATAVFDDNTGQLLRGLADLISEALKKSLENTLKQRADTARLKHHAAGYGEIVGMSPAIQKVFNFIREVKDLPVNVLITGESGTGKELVASILHRESYRSNKNFIAIDCSAIPESMLESELFGHEKGAFTGAVKEKSGLIEQADGGTLFIDEIGNISLSVQSKLLRFLDKNEFYRIGSTKLRSVDVRLVYATNKSIPALIKEGKFMEDLYFRLKRGVACHLPPLRERREDIMLIAQKFLEIYNKKFKKAVTRFSEEARQCLLRYSYPGNVRELDQFIANAVIWAKGDAIYPHDLPRELQENIPPTGATARPTAFPVIPTLEDSIYANYLPEDYRNKNFIWGIGAENAEASAAEKENKDVKEIQRELHERILVSIKSALNIPLKVAAEAVASAFERNYIIGKLMETNGKVIEAAQNAEVDKKTFIEKAKKHNLKKEWYVT